MNWGKAIVTIREKAGLKQVQLAEKIGISKTSLSLIESGKTKPSDDTLKKIADAFNTDISFIALMAINPDADMSEEDRARFNKLFPDFQNKILSFIK